MAVLLSFAVARLELLEVPGLSTLWQTFAALSAGLSLMLLVLYWHPWLVVGALLDVAVLAVLAWPRWPEIALSAR